MHKYINGEYQIVGVASSIRLSGIVGSIWKPTHPVPKWIEERMNSWAQQQAIDPAMTGKPCIGYNNTIYSTHVGMNPGQVLTIVPSHLNNQISRVWVKKNRTAKLYPKTSYGTDSYYRMDAITLTGNTPLPGSECNAYGCLHDLAHESVSKEGIASSMKCY